MSQPCRSNDVVVASTSLGRSRDGSVPQDRPAGRARAGLVVPRIGRVQALSLERRLRLPSRRLQSPSLRLQSPSLRLQSPSRWLRSGGCCLRCAGYRPRVGSPRFRRRPSGFRRRPSALRRCSLPFRRCALPFRRRLTALRHSRFAFRRRPSAPRRSGSRFRRCPFGLRRCPTGLRRRGCGLRLGGRGPGRRGRGPGRRARPARLGHRALGVIPQRRLDDLQAPLGFGPPGELGPRQHLVQLRGVGLGELEPDGDRFRFGLPGTCHGFKVPRTGVLTVTRHDCPK
jgi:hypothetical protein